MDERALHKSIGHRRSRIDAAERGLPLKAAEGTHSH
jgi:hypothetical protein